MASEAPDKPSTEQWAALCAKVEEDLPAQLGKETWYLLVACLISASPSPELLAPLYTHLATQHPSFSTAESKKKLSLRLRDVLQKQTTLIGAPRVLAALIAFAAAEGDPQIKVETSALSDKWKNLDMEAIEKRGEITIDSIYGPLLNKIFATFGSHAADIAFMEVALIYGLYLSEHSVLTPLETEVIVYGSILVSGLRGPSLWHTRGMGRVLGARGNEADENMAADERGKLERIKDVVRGLKVACMNVVEFVGPEFVRRSGLEDVGEGKGWPNVGDVSRELGGWGDDELRSE